MKHSGAGAPNANPPGRRRSRRGAALVAAAAAPDEATSSSSSSSGGAVQTGGGKSSSPSATGTRNHVGTRATATSRARSNAATAATTGTRSSPRRPKKPPAALAPAAAAAALREASSTATPPTAVARGVAARKASGKRAAPSSTKPAAAAAAAASGASTPLSSPLSATGSSKKRRSNGSSGGGGSGRGDGGAIADSDAAMEMLATLLSPVDAAREGAGAHAEQAQAEEREAVVAAAQRRQQDGDGGGGSEEDSNPCPLEAMFLALEQVLPLFRRRRQATLLKQIRPAVEGMCGRSFTRKHLARIVYVQPDAYKLSSKTDARPTRGGYRLRDLLIEIGPSPPAVDSDCATEPTAERTRGADGKGGSAAAAAAASSRGSGGGGRGTKFVSGETASARRREVFRRLLSSAKSRHCKCCDSRGTPPSGGAQGLRGDIDDGGECSCLPEAPLPDTSPLKVDGISGSGNSSSDGGGGGGVSRGGEIEAKGVGPSSSSLLSSPLPVEAQRRREASVGTDGWLTAGSSAGRRGTAVGFGGDGCDVEEGSDAPKSVESLRERLRQKDALSAKERNKSVQEKEADRRRKGNLPAMADAIRSYFAHSGRTTCSLDALVEALSSSSKHALSPKEARDRVRMISGLVPEWCKIIAPPPPPPPAASGGGGRTGGGDGKRGIPGGVDEGMVARPMKAKEVVRVNTRIRFDEVRQMIAFMAEGGGGGMG